MDASRGRTSATRGARRRTRRHRCGRAVAAAVLLLSSASEGRAAPPVEMVFVPASDAQPGGPAHDFEISRYEIRNDQFAEFLNDAMANRTNARGAYIYVDTTCGDGNPCGTVYINRDELGSSGEGPNDRRIVLFDLHQAGQIEFVCEVTGDPPAQVCEFQAITSPFDFSAHPVAGVTWYGALKYCNWLTLREGLPSEHRAYSEGNDLDPLSWRPVSISRENWATRDLTDVERAALLAQRGFRLPMDGASDRETPFNEWFKAAARGPSPGSFDSVYGFGRNEIDGVDANYSGSDAGIDGTTSPAGFFDGVQLLPDRRLTRDTNNGYGIYDLTGNVFEWVQDRSPANLAHRRVRGGSFVTPATPSLLLTNSFATALSAGSGSPSTGFRVARAVASDILVTPFGGVSLAGFWGGPYDDDPTGEASYDIRFLRNGQITLGLSTTESWATLDVTQAILAHGDRVTSTLTIDPACDGTFPVGTNTAQLHIRVDGELRETRSIEVVTREPIVVTPSATSPLTLPFGEPSESRGFDFQMENRSNREMLWRATWEDLSETAPCYDWLTLDGANAAEGSITSESEHALAVRVVSLPGDPLPPGEYRARIAIENLCTGSEIVRTVIVRADPALRVQVVGSVDESFRGTLGGPFAPSEIEYALTNLVSSPDPRPWTSSVCSAGSACGPCEPPAIDWLLLEPASGQLAPSETARPALSISDEADSLPASEEPYELLLRFELPEVGAVEDRLIRLTVEPFPLTPTTDLAFSGPRGGPFLPAEVALELRNTGDPKRVWTASIVPADGGDPIDWAEVAPEGGFLLDPFGTDAMIVTLTPQAATLPPGTYEANLHVTLSAQGGEVNVTRKIALTVGDESFRVETILIGGDQVQPGGPAHDFRIGKFEITNEEYARFLSSAYAAAASGDAEGVSLGSFVHIDTSTGSAYLGADPNGTIDTAPPAGAQIFLYNATVGNIALQSGGSQAFAPEEGFEHHPVAGVTWYGAVKFCNWLTRLHGMPESAVVYAEGPAQSDWFAKDVIAEDVITRAGYRLPMSGDAAPSPYNERHKVASRKIADPAFDENGNPLYDFTSAYGFGRDGLEGADANYAASGDPYDNNASPVGFFNGSNLLADGSPTRISTNPYPAFDLSGNVAEWGHETIGSTGFVFGGHFQSSASSAALNADGSAARERSVTLPTIGFRVAQSFQSVPIVMTRSDGVVPATLPLTAEVVTGGPVLAPLHPADPLDPAPPSFDLTNPAVQSAESLTLSVSSPGGWLGVRGTVPTLLAPGLTRSISLELSESATDRTPPPIPAPDLVLVRRSDGEDSGAAAELPNHDFHIGRTEVTNAQFRAFLSNVLADLRADNPTPRSEYVMIDLDSGNAYVGRQRAGEDVRAQEVPGGALPMFDAALSRISLSQGDFVVEPGYESHPVVGVSWYGAVKYGNWRTIAEGQPEELRAYHEGTSGADWRPAALTAKEWIGGTFPRESLERWARSTTGYRLPLDGGSTTGDPAASALNSLSEWDKVARAEFDVAHLLAFGAPYGFGRGTISPEDAAIERANFVEVDPATEEPLPAGPLAVGSFAEDGELPGGPSATRSENPLGILDLTGNVFEWVSDPFDPSTPATGTIRGGSWRSERAGPDLRNATRVALSRESVRDDVGFRIARGTGEIGIVTASDGFSGESPRGFVKLDITEPIAVSGPRRVQIGGPACTGLAVPAVQLLLRNTADEDMPFSASADRTWARTTITESGTEPGVLPASGGEASVEIELLDAIHELPAGRNTSIVTVSNDATGWRTRIPVEVDVVAPAQWEEPEEIHFERVWEGELSAIGDTSIALSRCDACGACDLEYQLSTSADWFAFDTAGGMELTGSMPAPGETATFRVQLSEMADALPPGTYASFARASVTDLLNPQRVVNLDVPVRLDVLGPLLLSETPAVWDIGCSLDPANPPALALSLTNRHPQREIDAMLSVDASWASIDPPAPSLLPGETINVTVTLDPAALNAPEDRTLTISLGDTVSGAALQREIVVRLSSDLCVTPSSVWNVAAAVGEAPRPRRRAYRVSNKSGGDSFEWSAASDADWLVIEKPASAAGLLAPDDSTSVLVRIEETALPSLPPGETSAEFVALLRVSAAGLGETVERTVTLRIVEPAFAHEEALVPGSSPQPGGPAHSFHIGRAPITNEQFAAFLNDALAHPANARGAYLYVDQTTGKAFVNTSELGEVGAGNGGRSYEMFDPLVADHILFDGAAYGVCQSPIDFRDHPVTGVSWYGAAKFANWMTLDQGMPESARCYVEGFLDLEPPAGDPIASWRPVSISDADWASRDLNDAEREALVTLCPGYRLPMDDGYANPAPSIDAADLYNEWFKAAAWNDDLERNTRFGFGRDVLSGADANYRCSGDAFENPLDCAEGGTTPVGYYDGSVRQTAGGALLTNPTANGFGLVDVTGNVNVWVQGRYAPPTASDRRGFRGGGFGMPSGLGILECTSRTGFGPATLTHPEVGLRLVRSAAADPVGCLSGPGESAAPSCSDDDLDGDGDIDLVDFLLRQQSP